MNKLSKQVTVTIIAALGVALAYTFSQAGFKEAGPSNTSKAQQKNTAANKTSAALRVSTITPELGIYQAQIEGFGTVTPVRKLTLSSEVSGAVVEISEQFKSGQTIQAGELLLRLNDGSYQQKLSQARANLAAAKVSLLEQQQKQQQAQTEWQRSGLQGQPESALTLYGPQVDAAKATMQAAQYDLQQARADLANTRIYAPFDAQIVSRSVELGSYLQTGANIGELYGSKLAEVAIPLSARAWQQLPALKDAPEPWHVTLHDTESSATWQAYVDRVEQRIDSNTRQRALILRVAQPLTQTSPLYPGIFVKASIQGKPIPSLYKVPTSAFSPNNELWLVDNTSTLKKLKASALFTSADSSFISASVFTGHAAPVVVAQPLSSYLPGMKVQSTAISDLAIKDMTTRAKPIVESKQ